MIHRMLYEGNNQVLGSDRIETLRFILEHEQHRSVTYEEAQEVAESLISFFEVLGDDSYPAKEFIDSKPIMQYVGLELA